MGLYPDQIKGRATDAAMSASAWATTGSMFSALRRIYTWLLAFAGVMPTTGTIATTANLLSAGTNDINATCKASITAAVKLARTVVGKALTPVATGNLFTISGGPIRVLGFVGLITTVIETKANECNIQFTPTGGAAINLCAVLDITGSAVRKFFTITGTKANAMALSADEGIVVANLASPLVLSPGVISLTGADSSTGAITWYMVYEAMDASSAVAAA